MVADFFALTVAARLSLELALPYVNHKFRMDGINYCTPYRGSYTGMTVLPIRDNELIYSPRGCGQVSLDYGNLAAIAASLVPSQLKVHNNIAKSMGGAPPLKQACLQYT